jgi:hypothetical protein
MKKINQKRISLDGILPSLEKGEKKFVLSSKDILNFPPPICSSLLTEKPDTTAKDALMPGEN